jgi:hypothetical protein
MLTTRRIYGGPSDSEDDHDRHRKPERTRERGARLNSRLRARNRISLTVWLENYANLFIKPNRGLINFEELGKPGPTTPITMRNFSYLDSDVAWRSQRTLYKTLRTLKALRWVLTSTSETSTSSRAPRPL